MVVARAECPANGGQMTPYNLYVGYTGTGDFVQSGGSNRAQTLYLGANTGGSGYYTLTAR